MAEEQGNVPRQKPEAHSTSVHLDVDGSLRFSEAGVNTAAAGGTLLDSALFNLNVAQQYIDESKHIVEHRLICFHYAIALLARYRQPYNKAKIGLARQYLVDAANWRFFRDENAALLEDAHDRIVCE